ncbi:MAG TPA: Rieske 2Fe-2S domain-containing protein [Pirellulales bacterium]|jgi:nitrite reductase/ring-hydroxylating ferredoxin subunit|nr:Rieske 2Fe-2S domain-containing protein [Pirellulales bacterium]
MTVQQQSTAGGLIFVAELAELRERKVVVVQGPDRPIAVFAHGDKVSAVDNRCPHLGFPLHRGTVEDGILTCHWHHARFDLASGCTFDLWADDVPRYEVVVRDGRVYVDFGGPRVDPRGHYERRLREGLEQDIDLIQAKSVIGLLEMGVEPSAVVRDVALFGVANRDDWASGLTSLTALANLAPHLSGHTTFLALCQGARRVASDCDGQPPRRERRPLETADLEFATLKRWFRYWTLVRHRDGAERTLLTAIRNGASPANLADMIVTAATDRFYADSGHMLDFANKAFELLDLIGWEHAEAVLPAIVPQLVSARGGEEQNAWRHPQDLVPVLRSVEQQLPELVERGRGKSWDGVLGLSTALWDDDPLRIIESLKQAIAGGARPEQLSQALAHAAALRIARFGTANELSDWITALHSFSFAHALDCVLRRAPSAEILRGVFHGAISVYLDRFLNIPPAPLPGERRPLDDEPTDADELRKRFLDRLDERHEVERAARVVARYMSLGHPIGPLIDTLTLAAVREDADFHAFQVLEAAVRQYERWPACPERDHFLIAAARYLAAHSPTQRTQLQTAEVALRLHRGDELYEADYE